MPPLSLMTRWALQRARPHSHPAVSHTSGQPGAGDGEMEMRAEDHRQQAGKPGGRPRRRRHRTEGVPPTNDEAVVDGEEAAGEADGGNAAMVRCRVAWMSLLRSGPRRRTGRDSRKGREQLKEHLGKGRRREEKEERQGEEEAGLDTLILVQKAQALKKIFNEGYWPPEHLGVGSNSTELVFIVGFSAPAVPSWNHAQRQSSLRGIGEHSPVGMELRALEVAMLSNWENEARAARRAQGRPSKAA